MQCAGSDNQHLQCVMLWCSVLPRAVHEHHVVLWYAGKTHLGMRLAELYGLLHVNVASILSELQHMDAETQKACCVYSWVGTLLHVNMLVAFVAHVFAVYFHMLVLSAAMLTPFFSKAYYHTSCHAAAVYPPELNMTIMPFTAFVLQLANQQLASREARLSPQLMAKLTQHLLLRHPTAIKQGWVLEGWPRSLHAAMLMTSVGAAGGFGGEMSAAGSDAGGKGNRRDSTASSAPKVGVCVSLEPKFNGRHVWWWGGGPRDGGLGVLCAGWIAPVLLRAGWIAPVLPASLAHAATVCVCGHAVLQPQPLCNDRVSWFLTCRRKGVQQPPAQGEQHLLWAAKAAAHKR